MSNHELLVFMTILAYTCAGLLTLIGLYLIYVCFEGKNKPPIKNIWYQMYLEAIAEKRKENLASIGRALSRRRKSKP